MNRKQLDTFEKLIGQLKGVYDELSVLSKKSPNDAVNNFKLQFVNTLLASCNVLLGQQYRPFSDFQQFDKDAMPQNSDVVFILSQYIECFEKLRSDNVIWKDYAWRWALEPDTKGGDSVYIGRVKPKRMKEID